MKELSPEVILKINPRHPAPEVLAQKLNWFCKRYGINTEARMTHFLAQLAHESNLVPQVENMWYSPRRLMQVWPKHFPTWVLAVAYGYKPFLIANRAYGKRLGNYRWDDGWRYRGRGLIQLTGRYNYRKFGELIGYDLENIPSLLEQYGVSVLVACIYWREYGLNELADAGDIDEITRRINGGYNGLGDRKRLLRVVKSALSQIHQ